MKRGLLAGLGFLFATHPALTADLPVVRKAPPPAVALYSWTGFYIGAHLGGGWGDKDWVAVGVSPLGSHDISGFLGGGQVGFNFQMGAWVFGAEGDFSWANLEGNHVDTVFFGNNITEVDWLGTVTGRLGYAWDRTLVYVKGGGAWASDKYTVTVGGLFFAGADATKEGWTIGAGLEYGFAPNWSAKFEYNYLDFGTDRVRFVAVAGGSFLRDVDQEVHAAKVGINYRFRPH
jgi:outer membrane immunogenic protein